ncbi:hypothetical protein PPTG_22139 [Phytophthora nicotianae INRA-310]|uniref:Transposase n=1 Tax=Phytophthora nicotianae (strain INRA-310) TaxID=761204 RepID=W2QN16_PHYN3|nr:hypothetical protein PPTG_22139 [Phytophthora nicotianae INRA-310]ETN14528.1 hypothetical protein PPTG_22139 [Phytophthora nicotianae INRA-310]
MPLKRSYKIQFKRHVIARVAVVGLDTAIKESIVSGWTVWDWLKNKEKIKTFKKLCFTF